MKYAILFVTGIIIFLCAGLYLSSLARNGDISDLPMMYAILGTKTALLLSWIFFYPTFPFWRGLRLQKGVRPWIVFLSLTGTFSLTLLPVAEMKFAGYYTLFGVFILALGLNLLFESKNEEHEAELSTVDAERPEHE